MSHKLIKKTHAGLSSFVLMLIGVVVAVSFQAQQQAGTVTCYNQPTTQTALAPSSVKVGETFTINDITGIGDTLGVTITSSTLTFKVTGATPGTFSKTWNGTATGITNHNYGSQTLTATGSAGSQIKIEIDEISSNVSLIGTINCRRSDNTLQLQDPGHSYTLSTINITTPTAPTSDPKPSTNPTVNQQNKSNPTSSTPTNSIKTAPTGEEKTDALDETSENNTNSSENKSTENQKNIEIKVTDENGNPLSNAIVSMDSSIVKTTDENGIAIFENVALGEHKISITAQDRKTVLQTINTSDGVDNGNTLGFSVEMPQATNSSKLVKAGFYVVPVILALAILTIMFITYKIVKKRKFNKSKLPQNSTQPVINPGEASSDFTLNNSSTNSNPYQYDKPTIEQLEAEVTKNIKNN